MLNSFKGNLWGRLKLKYHTSPLNYQINIAIGFIILVTILIITAITYFKTLNHIKQNFKDTGMIILQETSHKIDSRFKLVENTALMISSDSRIVNYNEPSNNISENEITRYLNNCIDFNKYDIHKEGLAYVQNLIDDIMFITNNSTIVARRFHFSVYNARSQLNNQWFKKAYAYKGNLIWTDCFYNNMAEQLIKESGDELNARLNQFMLIRYIVNEKNLNDVGYVAVSINLENLSRLIDNIQFGENGNIYIIDENGRIIASKDRSLLLKAINFDNKTISSIVSSNESQNFIEGKIGEKDYFIFHSPLSVNSWNLIVTIPVSELESSVSSTLFSVVIVGIISFIVVTFISTLILNNMSNPLKKVLMSIREIRKGNFSQKVDVKGCLEVNELSIEYNYMLDKITSLLKKIVDEQKALRKSELKTLRAQINPHFLYNTLDSIKWLVFAGNNEKASQLIVSLSTFFRIGLSGGIEEIPISDEIEHVKQYLYIQKLRCGENMNYLLEIDPSVERFKTPKLILQPIVENSILHGLSQKENKGFIKIVVTRLNTNSISFEITDNGIGMIEEDLKQLNAKINDPLLHSTAGNHGYAMRNVNQRIKLSYGSEYGISYKSKYGHGTKVTITIPVLE